MRRPIVAGNWKMYGSKSFVKELLTEIKKNSQQLTDIEMLVFPSYVFLEEVSKFLEGSNIAWGGQNVYPATEGAFTGEISVPMLKEFGCRYVLVGHSERRHILGESNQMVADKFHFSLASGLKPILCVGETSQQRSAGQTFEVILQQLEPILQKEGASNLEDAVIAYEPVWAIGTGQTATPEQAQEVHAFIRQEVTKINKSLAEKLRILYGGSVKQSNATALFAMSDIDGGLIGGASLNAKEFLEIAKICNS